MNLRPFKIYRVYLKPHISSNVGEFSWSWILNDSISLRASSPIWASEASLARRRERAAKPRGAEERRALLSSSPRSRVLASLASLAQIGELARRLRLYPCSNRERTICRRISTSSTKRRIGRFHVVVVLWTSKKCTKKRDARAELLFLLIKPIVFWRCRRCRHNCLSSLLSPDKDLQYAVETSHSISNFLSDNRETDDKRNPLYHHLGCQDTVYFRVQYKCLISYPFIPLSTNFLKNTEEIAVYAGIKKLSSISSI